MNWKPDDEEGEPTGALIPWKARDLKGNSGRRGFLATVRNLYDAVKGYTAEDVNRLREAGVQRVEGASKVKLAEAEEKLALAAKAHAEAEKALSEAEKIRAEAHAITMVTKVDAIERVTAAISALSQNGGGVAFNSNELKKLLGLESGAGD